MGGNWQRKNWYDIVNDNYWRSRYDPVNERYVFEWIAKNNLSADNWAENVNARIDCSGFDAGVFQADFTVREQSADNIPKTIHYSDGVDTYVAESDESAETTWSWTNLTKVFDGIADGGVYQRVNLAGDRNSAGTSLWATAVFDDDTNLWVKAKLQSTRGDITGWDAAVDVSDTANTAIIYGQSVRSVGDSGLSKRDMFFAWKQDNDLYSRFWDATSFETIQTIELNVCADKSHFDFEHGIEAGTNDLFILYLGASHEVLFRKRTAGDTDAWGAAVTL